jgi:CRP/FNR family transcriptional regulator, cyclic AMP receptor protein
MPADHDDSPRISEKDAARLLVTETALGVFGLEDALKVIPYLRPKRIKAGVTFLKEGERDSTHFLILVLSGDVRAECKMGNGSEAQTLYVVGPGHLLGEVAMFNGGARTASCVAVTDVAVAILSEDALSKMMRQDSLLASRFMLVVASRMADRIRETTVKLKRFMQLNEVLHKEVYTLMDAQPVTKPAAGSKRGFESTEPMSLEVIDALKTGLAGRKGSALAQRLNQAKTDFADL